MYKPKWAQGAILWAAAGLIVSGPAAVGSASSGGANHAGSHQHHHRQADTPIQHLVVIFDENISFDHYFGTYPHAANTNGVKWHAKPDTPTVNGLTPTLLHHNPNKMNPQRLGPAEALTCDQNHSYDAEQKAFNGGLMNKFVEDTGRHNCDPKQYDAPGLVMDYFDGNTVTALWNYAQGFAMSDNNYGTTFGPSTPGAINLISGNTHGAVAIDKHGNRVIDLNHIASPNDRRVGTLISDPDPDPMYDDCAGGGRDHAFFTGRNIGNLLDAQHVTWGWFSGGFRPTKRKPDGTPVCDSHHKNVGGVEITDYAPHHEPFQYYKSTANPKHLPPSSVAAIGHDDQANHQYGLTDFYRALGADNLPAVSFIKPPGFEKAHPGSSDPLDEQHFLVTIINRIQQSNAWPHTAVIVTYDDSDGWYDHAMGEIVNPSHDWHEDWLNGQGNCGDGRPMKHYQDRCGYGPRLPLIVISPYAKVNYVNHALTDQTSIIRFIEDNWLDGERIGDGSYDHLAGSLDGFFDWRHPDLEPLMLNPCTGQVRHGHGRQQHPHHCNWPEQKGGRDH
jgi:phospholipase C